MPVDIQALSKKLMLDKYDTIGLYNRDPYSPELEDLLGQTHLVKGGQKLDVLFVHCYKLEEMKAYLESFWHEEIIQVGGLVYLVYPKLKNPHYLGIHRDEIFPALGVDDGLGLMPGTHYKFNKMVSLNEVFTIIGLKYLKQKEIDKIHAGLNKPAVSGRVGDYIQCLPELKRKLKDLGQNLDQAFLSLTPGRQRNWARDIYSARTQATRNKRFKNLVDQLQTGESKH